MCRRTSPDAFLLHALAYPHIGSLVLQFTMISVTILKLKSHPKCLELRKYMNLTVD